MTDMWEDDTPRPPDKLTVVQSSVVIGVEGVPVSVEAFVSRGLPSFSMVGKPDGASREMRDRVRCAILSSGFKWPNSRITVNIAPTGQRISSSLDLPLALGILTSSGQVGPGREVWAFGELGLDGTVHKVPGVLPALDVEIPASRVLVPRGSDASIIRPPCIEVATLRDAIEALAR